METAQTLLSLLMMATVVFGVFAVMPLVNWLLAPRRRAPSEMKGSAFECGNVGIAQPDQRRHIGFYLIAIDFVLFDVELAFLYPWAVSFHRLGGEAMLFLLIFLGILAVGFIYAWKSGSLEIT
jgi:NADH-quinone oxidoreductase subunit A